ncbi:hypothetical protein Acr_17g0011570 [Actinidia rufa]|uniref:Reverse transcriptase domain-containing protein n=1 Tax=Actinidia rufa TaxID=165716 RepID=A0A7J0G464_9ERIC|nr:hypothetical protein Acr_17g0011570 [Actinidia rufa]
MDRIEEVVQLKFKNHVPIRVMEESFDGTEWKQPGISIAEGSRAQLWKEDWEEEHRARREMMTKQLSCTNHYTWKQFQSSNSDELAVDMEEELLRLDICQESRDLTAEEKRVSDVISEVQTAFLGGRDILEVTDFGKKRNKNGVIMKLDFEKAYDKLNWDYLIHIMKEFRFGDKWCEWIETCVSTVATAALVNGSPIDEIKMERGPRQRDSLTGKNRVN